MRQTLTPRSSESGFHRNLKFATFEEAGRLCKTIPQNGVKVAPLGGRSVPKLPHWLSMVYGWNDLATTKHPSNHLATPSNHPEHPSNRLATNPSNRLASGVVFLPLQAPFHIFLLEMYILVNGACPIWQSTLLLLLILINSSSSIFFFRRATTPAVFVTEPWMTGVKTGGPNRRIMVVPRLFISDRGYDVRPRGK